MLDRSARIRTLFLVIIPPLMNYPLYYHVHEIIFLFLNIFPKRKTGRKDERFTFLPVDSDRIFLNESSVDPLFEVPAEPVGSVKSAVQQGGLAMTECKQRQIIPLRSKRP